MDCKDSQPLLHAYADGELDLVRHVEVENHVKGCEACARTVENIRSMRQALRTHVPRYTASPELTARIQAALPKPVAAPSNVVPFPAPPRRLPLIRWGGASTAIAAAVCFGFILGTTHTRTNELEREAVSAHVRSMMANHLMDVASTDQHTVKPWFAGKLDFSPPVTDLASSGFPLVGGRLDQIDQHTAAALVYQRGKHTINLFVWPGASTEAETKPYHSDGYNVISWSQNGFHFLAISDVATPDLELLVKNYRSHL